MRQLGLGRLGTSVLRGDDVQAGLAAGGRLQVALGPWLRWRRAAAILVLHCGRGMRVHRGGR